MRDGDRNTAFFHSKTTTRAQVNKVEALQDSQGTLRRARGEMEQLVVQYFDDIFSSTQLDGALMRDVINTIEPRVSAKANQRLTLPFTAKEVTDALSCMYPLKSPDPDGFPALFYTRFRKVVGPNVITSVLKFLNSKPFRNL